MTRRCLYILRSCFLQGEQYVLYSVLDSTYRTVDGLTLARYGLPLVLGLAAIIIHDVDWKVKSKAIKHQSKHTR